MENEFILTPAQQETAAGLLSGIERSDVVSLRGGCGRGRTTILRSLHRQTGGVLLGVREFIAALMSRSQAGVEEAFVEALGAALARHDLVLLDDLHLITRVTNGCDYPRTCLLDAALTALLTEAAARGKKLLFATDEDDAPAPVRSRALSWRIAPFAAEDYACICRAYLGAQAGGIDYAQVHRFAPALNAHQLEAACRWLSGKDGLDTDRLIAHLQEQNMASNVELEEVPAVDWTALKGVDDVIQALEAKIALPLENDKLAAELALKPKRGVLLGGPPGTGKTTIGRALAHRLKSKFFLIDGTAVAGSYDFYDKVREVFDAARRNAPAIIFIDDADVIFEDGAERGFYRYLLTMLDGLESASAAKVCVMMTAMDAGALPPALVRSGRVELWLEMRLPAAAARAAIIRERVSSLPAPLGGVDVAALAAASRGLTGADLTAVIEDGKLLFAHDKVQGRAQRPVSDYFLEAIDDVRANRRNYGRPRRDRADAVSIGFCVER